MIKHLDKMIGAQVWSFSKGDQDSFLFDFAYFGAKAMACIPISIIVFSLVDSLINFTMFDSRLGSFIAMMVVYPFVDFFTIKKPEVRKFIAETSEEELDKYVDHYRYGIVIIILLFLGFIILFDK